jgi:hypothetical protein
LTFLQGAKSSHISRKRAAFFLLPAPMATLRSQARIFTSETLSCESGWPEAPIIWKLLPLRKMLEYPPGTFSTLTRRGQESTYSNEGKRDEGKNGEKGPTGESSQGESSTFHTSFSPATVQPFSPQSSFLYGSSYWYFYFVVCVKVLHPTSTWGFTNILIYRKVESTIEMWALTFCQLTYVLVL